MNVNENLILDNNWKKVKYYDYDFIVPNYVNWIVVRSDGKVYGLSEKPSISGLYWFISGGNIFENFAQFNLNGLDWRNTLRKV